MKGIIFVLALIIFCTGFASEHEAHKHYLSPSPNYNSVCKKDSPTITKIKAYLSSADDIIASKKLKGLTLKNQSEKQIKALKSLFKKSGFFTSLKLPASTDLSCEDIECVVSSIWGDELGLRIFYAKLRFNFMLSEYATSSLRRFKLEEVNSILASIEDLPEHVVKSISRSAKIYLSDISPKHAAVAFASTIKLSRINWGDNQSDFRRQGIITHELGHLVSNYHSQKRAWKKATQEEDCYFSTYATVSLDEDFAEHFIAYRYSAQEFKRQCPIKYNFMKNQVYKSFEYLDDSLCQTNSRE